MLVLDTNVVSEALRPIRSPNVDAWFKTTERSRLFISAISKAELLSGLAGMPAGKRKIELAGVIWRFLTEALTTEILAFGSREAELFAEVTAHRRSIGRPISQSDAQIASIARVRGFAIVTGNVRDFAHCGIEIVNPREHRA